MTFANVPRPMGPKRMTWERLKRAHDKALARIRRFNIDLASAKQNNPNCTDMPIEPISPPEPLPPMPTWSE